jgi:hypothetical protein
VRKPRLLTEALRQYRLEDRVTELFALALHTHDDFCRRLLSELGVVTDGLSLVIRTQGPEFRPRLVDLIVRCHDDGREIAVVYFEHKYAPPGQQHGHWFHSDQASEQRAALTSMETAPLRRLIGIASKRAENIWGYDELTTWAWVTDVAEAVGGGDGWRNAALLPRAPASQRILLEFVSYMKGDDLGGLIPDDLDAIGRRQLAAKRVTTLLAGAAQIINQGTSAQVLEDWETPSGAWIHYVLIDPAPDSWLATLPAAVTPCRYLFITDYGWNESASAADPIAYAGVGWGADAEARAAIHSPDWLPALKAVDLELLEDGDGVYITRARPLRSLIKSLDLLSGQADAVAHWAQEAMTAAEALPNPYA